MWGWGDLNNRPHGHQYPLDPQCPPGHVCVAQRFGNPIEYGWAVWLHDFGMIDPLDPFSAKKCPSGKELLDNATVQAALDQAFSDSKAGTHTEHEEGGYIWGDRSGNIMITRVPAGPMGIGITGPMGINIPIDSTPNAPALGFALVGYFHTHPYDEDQPINGTSDVYGVSRSSESQRRQQR